MDGRNVDVRFSRSGAGQALAFGSRLNGRRGFVGAFLVAAMAAAMAAGCGQDEGIRLLKGDAEFVQAVDSPRPVLVDIYKAGCPTCGALEPILATLEREYRGRADFCKIELVRSGFVITAPQLQARHQIDAYPTVILFVKGAEVRRWEMHLELDDYRKALDEALRR